MLLQIWENAKSGGYRVAAIFNEQIVEKPSFKQAVTVARWLIARGLASADHTRWKQYVEFALKDFKKREQTPILGQIKNPILLGRFRRGCGQPAMPPPPLFDADALERRYAQALAPELADDPQMLMFLGLRRTNRTNV